MRIVEDIAVSRLGRGDAILLGVEYMPIAHQQQYNEENNNDIGVVTNGTIACLINGKCFIIMIPPFKNY
jgi:hypothetical protein